MYSPGHDMCLVRRHGPSASADETETEQVADAEPASTSSPGRGVTDRGKPWLRHDGRVTGADPVAVSLPQFANTARELLPDGRRATRHLRNEPSAMGFNAAACSACRELFLAIGARATQVKSAWSPRVIHLGMPPVVIWA